LREENKTWWPDFTHNLPTVLPMLPEPMTPIFVPEDLLA
jgi:hypothetical protein